MDIFNFIRHTFFIKWDTHISKISSEANLMIGLHRRNLKYSPKTIKEAAYKSYARPKTEYCATIWDPHTKKGVHQD